ncbi:MAG: hypothetical protein WC977_05825, partial [Anaerovoracaceae bacterium]
DNNHLNISNLKSPSEGSRKNLTMRERIRLHFILIESKGRFLIVTSDAANQPQAISQSGVAHNIELCVEKRSFLNESVQNL